MSRMEWPQAWDGKAAAALFVAKSRSACDTADWLHLSTVAKNFPLASTGRAASRWTDAL